MKNKKGFTLVELLAVIAILAILVIIALPNVVKMFNNAKKSTFLTEAQTIYKEVSKKYISESMKGNKISVIDSNGTKLDIQTSEDLEYNITVDSQGNVSNFKVSNNSYCISGNFGNISDLTIDKVTEGKCTSAVYCTSNKELTKGTTYVNGPYTYTYMLELDVYGNMVDLDDKIIPIEPEGWSVVLTDKSSTAEVNSPLCTYIDEKPVVSMQSAFYRSNAKKIDLSNYDTSKIISMKWAFGDAKADTIILNNIDTSNVITMTAMFYGIKPKTFDISGLDTEKVYNMSSMFGYSKFDTLDLSTFSTPSLKYTNTMFARSTINKLNLNSFDTSKVEGMNSMFSEAIIPTIDLRNFIFKDGVNINGMFTNSKINTVYVQDKYIQNFNDSTKPSSLEIKSK